jgi:hypothetical protein
VLYCAVLAAAKSQIVKNLKGDVIRGIGISFTQIIQNLKATPESQPKGDDKKPEM